MIAATETRIERPKVWTSHPTTPHPVKRYLPAFLVAFFSILYFVEIGIRASEKYFWYDELLTVYFSRLPNLHAIWNALGSGVDSNPPLFFLLTRASEAAFGEGPIGTRVPEILGFWMFCLCIFLFVSRRVGPIPGLIAMLLPTLTGAFYYAYEARPHAIVLGCCGIALVCWQHARDSSSVEPRRVVWLTGFGIALFCAFMLHAYALVLTIPFGLAGLWQGLRDKEIKWGFWIALAAPVIPAVLMYIPLQHYFATVMKGTPFLQRFPSSWEQMTNFYTWLISSCFLLFLFLLLALLLNLSRRWLNTEVADEPRLPHLEDIVLGIGFLLVPAYGIVIAKIAHAPFFSRYFLSALSGVCILLGLAFGIRGAFKRTALVILLVVGSDVALNCSRVVWHRYNRWDEALIEPSTRTLLESSLSGPLSMHSLLLEQRASSKPIALLDPSVYLYFSYYAPELAKRVYCLRPSSDDLSYRLIKAIRQCCKTTCNREITDEEFVRMNHRFLAYGMYRFLDRLAVIQGHGSQIGPLRVANGYFLVEISR